VAKPIRIHQRPDRNRIVYDAQVVPQRERCFAAFRRPRTRSFPLLGPVSLPDPMPRLCLHRLTLLYRSVQSFPIGTATGLFWLCVLPCPRSTPPRQPIKARAAETAARRKRYQLFGMLSPKQAGLAGATPSGRGNDGRSVSCSFPFIAARRFLGKVQRRRRGSASNTAFQIGRPGRRRGLCCNSLPRLADEFFGDSANPRIVRRDMRPGFRLPGRSLLSAEKRRCRPCSELADRRHGADFVWSTLVGGRHRGRRGYRR
jgi:hypothetical protein